MVMTAGDDLFVDTNILVYATDTLSPWNMAAVGSLQNAIDTGTTVVISPQIISEYLAVASRSSLTIGMPQLATIIGNIQMFRRRFRVVEENDAVIDALLNLM